MPAPFGTGTSLFKNERLSEEVQLLDLDLSASLGQLLEYGQGCAHATVIGHLAICQRYIEVGTNEHAAASNAASIGNAPSQTVRAER